MMQTKISKAGTNTGSSVKLATYLEKENAEKIEQSNEKNQDVKKEQFFSASSNTCNKWEVVQKIDENGKGQGLKSHEDRFYSIVIAPSREELKHIGNDSEKLKDYTRSVMDNYAKNFNKGIDSKDLVWYAKVEHERKYNHYDPEVKEGLKERGDLKEGDQRHIHIIVSRCAARENNHVLQADKKERTMKLSPTTHHKGESKGAVNCGFDRKEFIRSNEQSFDNKFQYERSKEQSFDYCNGVKNGNKEDHERALQKTREVEKSKQIVHVEKMDKGEEKSKQQERGYQSGY